MDDTFLTDAHLLSFSHTQSGGHSLTHLHCHSLTVIESQMEKASLTHTEWWTHTYSFLFSHAQDRTLTQTQTLPHSVDNPVNHILMLTSQKKIFFQRNTSVKEHLYPPQIQVLAPDFGAGRLAGNQKFPEK